MMLVADRLTNLSVKEVQVGLHLLSLLLKEQKVSM